MDIRSLSQRGAARSPANPCFLPFSQCHVRSAFLLCAMLLPLPLFAASPVISYVIDLTHPDSHLAGVTMTVPQAHAGTEIQFPAWNALYQIRDFVRNVQNLRAQCSGKTLTLTPVDVNTWAVRGTACSPLTVSYQVYANEAGVFSSQVISDHAFINLAEMLFYVPDQRDRRDGLSFILPPGWKLVTFLPGEAGEFTAADYDALVDSPVEAGSFQLYAYRQNGALYRIAVRGHRADYSSARLLKSIEKITATETALMRNRPFSRYTFIFHFGHHSGGGMEHADGTAIGFPAGLIHDDWIGLENTIAHEFFHLWNVKRIRPQGLEPIDYVHGNDTRDLWFSEGVTSTYAKLTLVRSGLMSHDDFYKSMASAIQQLQRRPARRFQSVELAGMDAWLEKYPDYLRSDRSISYYNKGELLGDLLDLAIRHASGNVHSLDSLMRRLNTDFAERRRCFTDASLEEIITGLGPSSAWVHAFFNNDVRGTKELNYQKFLSYAGLRLEVKNPVKADWGFHAVRDFGGLIRVVTVEPSSGAAKAGIERGDILTGIGNQDLYALPQNLRGAKPGQRVTLHVMRKSKSLTLKFSLGSKSGTAYQIDEVPHATPQQIEIRNGWLDGKTRNL